MLYITIILWSKHRYNLIIIEMRKIVKVFYVSLGCDKNLVDSEKMLGMLHEAHYELTDNEYEADIIIVNTCAFIGDAKEESINNIIEMGKLKETGKCRKLIVTGCLAQRYKEEIEKGASRGRYGIRNVGLQAGYD